MQQALCARSISECIAPTLTRSSHFCMLSRLRSTPGPVLIRRPDGDPGRDDGTPGPSLVEVGEPHCRIGLGDRPG